MIKLNLGCGQNKVRGFINVDKYDSFSPEIVWDLEIFPWPFEDNSVDEIVMSHCLEHIGATNDIFFSIIKELYRICCTNAKILISVPHPRSDNFLNDPTHVRPITEGVMELFSKAKNREWQENGAANSPLGIYLNVDFEIKKAHYVFSHLWIEKLKTKSVTPEEMNLAAHSYFNVIDEIQLTLSVCK